MSNNLPVIHGETHETPQMKRLRLASELRFLSSQFNSKVAELLDAGLSVRIHTNVEVMDDRDALIGNVEVSYQTPRKFY